MGLENCWEVKNCGREPGGSKVEELGVCSAATNTKLDGIHGGINAGRACWVVAGTLCGGEKQGSYAMKMENCNNCDFFISVKSNENGGFISASKLLTMAK